MDAAGASAFAKRKARTLEAADTANTANAADMRGAKADATNVSTAAEAANVSAAAEAAAHVCTTAEAAAHAATMPAAASAAPRIGLRNRQARSQQGRRQNRDRLSHRLLHSVNGTERAISKLARTEASDELEIGFLPRSTIKMTFRHFTPRSRRCAASLSTGDSFAHSFGLRRDNARRWLEGFCRAELFESFEG
jgi:hypothetical protein